MSKVIVSLVDRGSAIDAFGLNIKGDEKQEIELTDEIKNLKRQNLIFIEPIAEKEPEQAKAPEEPKVPDEEKTPEGKNDNPNPKKR
jgi:hypothetical protein